MFYSELTAICIWFQDERLNTIHKKQLEQPTQKWRKIYNLMNGIPGLQNISGKIFYIY